MTEMRSSIVVQSSPAKERGRGKEISDDVDSVRIVAKRHGRDAMQGSMRGGRARRLSDAPARDALASNSVASGKGTAFVVFRAEAGRADGGNDRQKLLEGHVQVQETTLAEDPSVVIEDFIRNHQRQARERRDRGKSPRLFDVRQFSRGHVTNPFAALAGGIVTLISQRNDFTSGASRHE